MATPSSTLLLLDVHKAVLDRLPTSLLDPLVAAMAQALALARAASIPVIFVVPHYRPGYPELDPRHSEVGEMGLFVDQPIEAGIPDALQPRAGEIVVGKYCYSPFYMTDLSLILRRLGTHHLALGGVATSGVVLSAVRDAYDMGFDITVLQDLCADFDQEVHRILIGKIFPPQAEITTTEQWSKRHH